MKIRSKRHGRIRSLQDADFDSPYSEVIINGKRYSGFEDSEKIEGIPLIRIPLSLLHSKIARSEVLLKSYARLLNIPTEYNETILNKEILPIKVKNLIIGCGSSGLSILEELGKDNTIAICHRELGYVEYDSSEDPLINKNEIIKRLKIIYKENQEKIINGIFLGNFSEGLAFDARAKILLINAENIFLASGSRYILPLFNGNDNPKVISRNLFLMNKKKYKRIIVLGSSDDALRTALNADNAIVLHKEGARYFSKFYLEEVEKKGYEIIGVKRLKFKEENKGVFIITDKGEWYADVIVYAVVRQPKIEISSNLEVSYNFFDLTHVYLPFHDLFGITDKPNVFVVGGMRGISIESLSYFSSKFLLNKDYEFKENLKKYEPYLYNYYDGKWEHNYVSPYLFDNDGYICE
ncbi:MAG: FAD-dependent oxidoreductase, partial [Sulfolobaceae archaeon]